MEHDEGISNPSNNRPFEDVLNEYASRRQLLRGGLTLAAGSFLAGPLSATAAVPAPGRKIGSRLIDFQPVTLAEGNGPVPAISPDYDYQVLIPWGTSLTNNVTDYSGDPLVRPTAEEQAQQVGIGHDGMWFFPFRRSSNRGLLAINHEYGTNGTVLGKADPETLADVMTSQHAHGISVLEIRKTGRGWELVKDSMYNRRVHGRTPVEFSGPVAGSELIGPEAGAMGTLNNCANGYTPWGTYLTCEENFNGYFGTSDSSWTPSDEQARYGLSAGGFGYSWHVFDERFDLASDSHPNEENRFGWIVEVDPFNPEAMPLKRTAMGRFKHEGVALVEGRGGRVVGYMGDDERFDYIYKFVSAGNWRFMRAQGVSPLDNGTLYAAKFNDDGTGEWLELSLRNPAIAARFSSEAEMLTYTRIAADLAGATPMDRPEWTSVGADGTVYCTLTNNSRREEADAANPQAPNPDGHIIRWRDSNRHIGRSFTWEIFLLSSDTHGTERSVASPDGIWVDPDNRVFIQTDGAQKDGLNDQLLIANGNQSGDDIEISRLFTGVTGCEVTGIAVTPNRRTLFVNLQHPGNGDPSVTNFPAAQGSGTIPRDCTVVITRKDGGVVGS
ncbi:PhoX family protein [Haliea salexigens]|nr:PhoX family phosphatase [Haliea salexigens]